MTKRISRKKKVRKKIKKKILEEKKFPPLLPKKIRVQVVGIGGGGGQIVSEIAPRLKRIKFMAANTDLQALKKLSKDTERFQLGQNVTLGLGTGMDPELGEKTALQDLEKIKKIFRGQDFTIFISCLGGGTGSGATPIFAKAAKDLKNYTLGIFTLPFLFEGKKRRELANVALDKIKPNLNAYVVVPNERIFQFISEKTEIKGAFSAVNNILVENLEGLIETLFLPGVINIDFADLKTILAGRGKLAFLNTVLCYGENRAEEATKRILENPLLDYGLPRAKKILFNISGPKDLAMAEVEKISNKISDFDKSAKIIFGISQNEKLKDSLKITLLAVGCGEEPTIAFKKRKRKKKVQIIAKPRRKRLLQKPKIREIKPERPEIKKEESAFAKASAGNEEKIEIKTRRNALEVKKDLEKAEKEILVKESQWETPAFLRRKVKKS